MCTTFGCDRGAARPASRQARKNGGLSEGLEIRQADSNVVGIICLLVEIGLTDLPKTEGASAPPPPSIPTALAWNTEEEGKPQTFHFLPQLANLPQQLCIAQLRELGRLERCWLKKSWK